MIAPENSCQIFAVFIMITSVLFSQHLYKMHFIFKYHNEEKFQWKLILPLDIHQHVSSLFFYSYLWE